MKLSPNKQYVLLKGEDNYADEFGVEFFAVMEKTHWESIDRNAKRLFAKITKAYDDDEDCGDVGIEWQGVAPVIQFYFGTNECVIFNGYKDWRAKITVSKITHDDAKVIVSKIGSSFGTNFANTNFIEQLMDNAGEEPNVN